jgi:glycosyltransferase involved in cell wall biosynthesis
MKRYIAITPARDEQELLPHLIASMAAQSWLPERWIIIDDGSADRTAGIVDDAARTYPWIEARHLPRNRTRAPGGEGVIAEFIPLETCKQYDFVMRLDADVSFDSDFAAALRDEFVLDPSLGIASPTLWEPERRAETPAPLKGMEADPPSEEWQEVRQPEYHTRGPAKLYSIECFAAIGDLDPDVGWDTLDEARAMVRGFRTRSFRNIIAKHHRPQGEASGWKARMTAGLAAYRVGYSPLFMIARAARHTFSPPAPFAGALMLAGYASGYLRGEKRCAEPEVVQFIRRQQHRRLLLQESVWR